MRTLPLLLALAAPLPDRADAQTVEAMMHLCEDAVGSDPQGTDAAYCLGVANGIAQVLIRGCQAATAGANIPPAFKAAQAPSTAAVVQAFLNWARRYPNSWGRHFSETFMLAVSDTFPCES